MGQKVNPIGFRLGINHRWLSNWYTDKGHKEFVNEDAKIREFLAEQIQAAGLSRTEITRAGFKDDTGKNLPVVILFDSYFITLSRIALQAKYPHLYTNL